LKNVTLSYDLPQLLVRKIGLAGGQIYLSGMNLWEASKIHDPLDPEQLHQNVLSGENFNGAQEYPIQRIYSLGLSISF
jgi:hypothetical protein